jgi:pimeloyl-ACP methyl ester carboxylesterase
MVVFVHGLVQGEEAWGPRIVAAVPGEPEPHPDDGRPYGERLENDLGLTPVYVRYNSGLRVSDNGQRLSNLLDDLVAAWPVPVEQIALVGASMGGLVARSACYYGDRDDKPWAAAVRTVVTLGTPHLGAPLEQGAHVVDIVLRKTPETEPFSRILGSRSVGVKDLRYGNLVEEDWFGYDPDELLTDRATHVPFLDHATYYFVAATVTSDAAHPAGHLLGDGLVRYASASGNGKTRRIPFDHDKGFHLTGVHHLSMLNHPIVYTKLREWLAPLAATKETDDPS